MSYALTRIKWSDQDKSLEKHRKKQRGIEGTYQCRREEGGNSTPGRPLLSMQASRCLPRCPGTRQDIALQPCCGAKGSRARNAR